MKVFKIVECTDYKEDYGVIIVRNKNILQGDIQNKIDEFKNSYKAYGYSTLKEMKEDGYKTVDDLFINETPQWNIDDLIKKAFPKSWKVSRCEFNGIVEC